MRGGPVFEGQIARVAAGLLVAIIGVALALLAHSTLALVLALGQILVGLWMAWSALRSSRGRREPD